MKTSFTVHPSFQIGRISPMLFGGFIEHVGRVIYGGIYDPASPKADADGFRTDVMDEMKKLSFPFIRYPGGNFVSAYDWRDGVGPKESRKHRFDAVWRTVETNEFGVDEFMKYCRMIGAQPMLAVNLGTGSPTTAQELVEYCNLPGGTFWSDKRRKYASEEPYNVKLWCLGNEMDGEWQAGFDTARHYGARARETAKLMTGVDPSIKLIGCGSSHRDTVHFGNWENESLDEMYDYIDYLSCHTYLRNPRGDIMYFFTKLEAMSRFIAEEYTCCEFVRLRKRRSKRLKLCFDEWNVFRPHTGEMTKDGDERWKYELDRTDFIDAMMTGGAMITLLNHADVVEFGAFAQPVNLTGLIETDNDGRCWRQISWFPSFYTAKYAKGVCCLMNTDSPCFEMEKMKFPYLYSCFTFDASGGEAVMFALNRNLNESMDISGNISAFGPESVIEALSLHSDDPAAVNSYGMETVRPEPLDAVIRDGLLSATLPPASWNMIRIKVRA